MNLIKRGVFHDAHIGEYCGPFFSRHADQLHHCWKGVIIEAIGAAIANSPLRAHRVEYCEGGNVIDPRIYFIACKVLFGQPRLRKLFAARGFLIDALCKRSQFPKRALANSSKYVSKIAFGALTNSCISSMTDSFESGLSASHDSTRSRMHSQSGLFFAAQSAKY